jgi:hypothetical protein
MDNSTSVIGVINALIEEKFTGSLKISFSRGIIPRIEKFEEILKK